VVAGVGDDLFPGFARLDDVVAGCEGVKRKIGRGAAVAVTFVTVLAEERGDFVVKIIDLGDGGGGGRRGGRDDAVARRGAATPGHTGRDGQRDAGRHAREHP
jgi:hypothetical protein